jgi:hypothetical protein
MYGILNTLLAYTTKYSEGYHENCDSSSNTIFSAQIIKQGFEVIENALIKRGRCKFI